MGFRIANCPVSWGVEEADAATNVPWTQYLDDAAAAGYSGVEVGPLGYLPTDVAQLRDALQQRGLELSAGYVMEPLARPEARDEIIRVTKDTCAILRAFGAEVLILIDDMYPERTDVAGRTDAARRLDVEEMKGLVDLAEAVARIATDDYGLAVAFHPHVGTFVEYEDEIESFLSSSDPDLLGLCIDTGHSVYADVDPVALFDDNRERVRYMHLKDVDERVLARARDEKLSFDEAVTAGIFCPVGSGMVDYPVLARAASATSFDWVAVEQDRAPEASYPTTPLRDATQSFEYLRSLGMVRGA